MDAGLIYTNARLKSLEAELFGKDKMQRIADAATTEEATRVLQEGGYPAGADYLEMLSIAERDVTELFKQSAVQGYGLECFLIMNDCHNAKVAAKRVYLESKSDSYKPDGLLSARDMEESIRKEDFSSLPAYIQDALAVVKTAAACGTLLPSVVDVELDKAAFRAVSEVKRAAPVAEYFTRLADYANILVAYRASRAGIPAVRFEEMILTGGSVPATTLRKLYELGIEEAQEKLALPAEYKGALAALKEGVAAYETYRDDALIAPIKKARYDMFSPAAVMGFYIGKLREITNIRLLFARINNGVAKEVIKTRLREQYV